MEGGLGNTVQRVFAEGSQKEGYSDIRHGEGERNPEEKVPRMNEWGEKRDGWHDSSERGGLKLMNRKP